MYSYKWSLLTVVEPSITRDQKGKWRKEFGVKPRGKRLFYCATFPAGCERQFRSLTTSFNAGHWCIDLIRTESTVFVRGQRVDQNWSRGVFCVCQGVAFLCPRHSKNGGGALRVTPVCASVRASVIKSWCLLNNFWKTASIQFKFGMLIYNIKTQVEFDLGYNPLIFDRVMGLL